MKTRRQRRKSPMAQRRETAVEVPPPPQEQEQEAADSVAGVQLRAAPAHLMALYSQEMAVLQASLQRLKVLEANLERESTVPVDLIEASQDLGEIIWEGAMQYGLVFGAVRAFEESLNGTRESE